MFITRPDPPVNIKHQQEQASLLLTVITNNINPRCLLVHTEDTFQTLCHIVRVLVSKSIFWHVLKTQESLLVINVSYNLHNFLYCSKRAGFYIFYYFLMFDQFSRGKCSNYLAKSLDIVLLFCQENSDMLGPIKGNWVSHYSPVLPPSSPRSSPTSFSRNFTVNLIRSDFYT